MIELPRVGGAVVSWDFLITKVRHAGASCRSLLTAHHARAGVASQHRARLPDRRPPVGCASDACTGLRQRSATDGHGGHGLLAFLLEPHGLLHHDGERDRGAVQLTLTCGPQIAPIIIALRVYEEYLPLPNWTDDTAFPDVMQRMRVQYTEVGLAVRVGTGERAYRACMQNVLYSLIIMVGWIKLFDYLSVFSRLYRLIVIIEMVRHAVRGMLLNRVRADDGSAVVLGGHFPAHLGRIRRGRCGVRTAHVRLAFRCGTVCAPDYVAYGYLDPKSYTLLIGFVARIFGACTPAPCVLPKRLPARATRTTQECSRRSSCDWTTRRLSASTGTRWTSSTSSWSPCSCLCVRMRGKGAI
jgi:hypothetical protein